jgi:hypothetical protein
MHKVYLDFFWSAIVNDVCNNIMYNLLYEKADNYYRVLVICYFVVRFIQVRYFWNGNLQVTLSYQRRV